MIALQKIINKLYADHKWQTRSFSCGCDHNEYCNQCFPPEFQIGGEYADVKAFDGTDLEAAVAELAELRAKAEVRAVPVYCVAHESMNEDRSDFVITYSHHDEPVQMADNIVLYAAPPAQAVAPPDASHYLIWFDDADRKPELFNDKDAALKRYEQISISWNAHLFVLANSNSRDAGTKPAQAVSVPESNGWHPDGIWTLVQISMLRRIDEQLRAYIESNGGFPHELAPICSDLGCCIAAAPSPEPHQPTAIGKAINDLARGSIE